MSVERSLRIGTRGSALALAQAALVAQALRRKGIDVQIVEIETAGDRRAPDTAWGEGAFVSAIERALLDGRVDIAVHSAKDIPTEEDQRLTIAAYLEREEPRDALVLPSGRTGSLDALTPGSVIGTDSPRRTGFLRAFRGDLEIVPLHGNVDTRLRRLDSGAVDALVLAAAGLIRLGRADRISELLPVEIVPPAPGQGAIAVQIRSDDERSADAVRAIDDPGTRIAVETERAFLQGTGGGCRAPIGSLATIEDGHICLLGGFATIDGRAAHLVAVTGPTEESRSLAGELANKVVAGRSRLPGAPRVLVTRPESDSAQLVARLADHGIAAVVVPAIEIELMTDDGKVAATVQHLSSFDWAIATSANAVRAISAFLIAHDSDAHGVRWAAIGRATTRELGEAGVRDVWQPSSASAATIADELPLQPNDRVVWFHGDLADLQFADSLTARGARVEAVCVYRTVVAPRRSAAMLAQALGDGPIAAVVLASPSAAHGLIELATPDHLRAVRARAICVGERTANAARSAGYQVVVTATSPDPSLVAEVTAEAIAKPQPALSGVTN